MTKPQQTDSSTPQRSPDWWIYHGYGTVQRLESPPTLPPAPPWRRFRGSLPEPARVLPPETDEQRGAGYQASDEERELVNMALYLRRPLMITGRPGSGKSTLAYAIAYELRLGPVLRWSITTRSTLAEGLYQYDAIGRLQEASLPESNDDIGNYIRLGPLGTALLPSAHPRVLLIDEIDKSDIDLPNDLLNVFEEGEFLIPELTRLSEQQQQVLVYPADGDERVPIERGHVLCHEFPLVVMTSNGERDFPPAFLRRCLRHTIQQPDKAKLARIVDARLNTGDGLDEAQQATIRQLIERFHTRREKHDRQELATDQLLNAVHLLLQGVNPLEYKQLLDIVFKPLDNMDQT
ncbi:MAG: MoxR family ATPase [Chloroflexaceae bacterium]|nr:MoxR family ATPase [Chloroflexaceae bacterium]